MQSSVQTWNVVSHIKGRTQTENVCKEGAEDIWT